MKTKIFNIKFLSEMVGINYMTFRGKMINKIFDGYVMKFSDEEIAKIERYLLESVNDFISGLRNCK